MAWKHLGHYGANTMFSTRLDYWVNEEEGVYASCGGYMSAGDEVPDSAAVETLPAGGVDELVSSKGIEID